MHVRLRRIPSPFDSRIRAVLAVAACVLCATPPAHAARLFAAIADWTSVVVAALPYVASGVLAALILHLLRVRERAHGRFAIAVLAVCNPGCDCALNGYVDALACGSAPLAGFVLTFAAMASPAALAVTFAALGPHMAVIRALGATLAAALTAAAWRIVPARRALRRAACAAPFDATQQLASALVGVICAAAVAAAGKQLLPPQFFSHISGLSIAVTAAVLSPCSTADPLMAATLLRSAHDQAAFILAAQGASVRQMALLARGFGTGRAIAAVASCAIACCAIVAIS